MKKNFKTMTEQERSNYLKDHFMFEVRMLFFSLRQNILLKNTISRENSDSERYSNMTLESFLLHAKVLLEFFYDYGKSSNSQYIRAWHFYNNLIDYGKIIPQKSKAIKLFEERVNTEISHLGANRINDIFLEKSWDIVNILHDFMNLVKIFIDHLPKKYFSEELRDY